MHASLTVHTTTNLEIIANYKSLAQPGNPSEIYKWQLVEKFKNRPDLNSDNFIEEVQAVTYNNLIYHNAIAVRKHILIANADDYRNALTYLFDESIDLEERIVTFQDVYTSLGQTLSHHHDERTISTLLSFKYPEKYPLYKYSFYKTYCEKLGIKTAQKNKKYIHYIELVKQFIRDFVIKDEELLSFKQRFLTADCYADINHLIFAQDILYQVFSIKESDLEEELEETTNDLVIKNMTQHLNQILYGPPGTGKTYHTIDN